MDKRTLRTRFILGKALADLLQNMPLHRISIRQVTDHAGVAYSTFFRNFTTIEELLESYVNDFLVEAQALATEIDIDNFRETTRRDIRIRFEHVASNTGMYRMIWTTPAIQNNLSPFKQFIISSKVREAEQLAPHFLIDAPPIDLLIRNEIQSLIGLIEWWLLQELPPEIEVTIQYYEEVVIFPTWRLLLGNQKANQILDIPLL